MANTPEVDEYLQKTMNLVNAAIALSGANNSDDATWSMMRQVQTAVMTLLTAMQRIPAPTSGPPQGGPA